MRNGLRPPALPSPDTPTLALDDEAALLCAADASPTNPDLVLALMRQGRKEGVLVGALATLVTTNVPTGIVDDLIQSGVRHTRELVTRSGQPETTVRNALELLLIDGRIRRAAHGEYEPAASGHTASPTTRGCRYISATSRGPLPTS